MAQDETGKAPLRGKRILITRSREQASALRDALAALGADPVEFPTIEIRDPDSWEPLDRAIRNLESYDYLLVTSANGVERLLARMKVCGRDLADLQALEIGAIGPATAAAFEKAGVKVDFVPPEYQGEGLLEALRDRNLAGKSFLIPRAKVARDLVPRVLTERGARVDVVEAYQAVPPSLTREEIDRKLTPLPDMITFSSSSTALNFVKLVGQDAVKKILAGVDIASIGPITSETVRQLGVAVTVEAAKSTIPGLVAAIVHKYSDE